MDKEDRMDIDIKSIVKKGWENNSGIEAISENIAKGIENGLAKAKAKVGEAECPFCGEHGFDLIGLKYHLGVYCGAYEETALLDDDKVDKDRRASEIAEEQRQTDRDKERIL